MYKKDYPIPLLEVFEESPSLYDIKYVTKFAFLPIRLDNNNLIWLRKYKEVYQYQNLIQVIPNNCTCYKKSQTKILEHNEWILINKIL